MTDLAADAGRNSLLMSGVIALSRLSGLGRVAVVTAVLGAGYLGNVYASSNTVPNFLFESVASGALQASLLPALVARLNRTDRAEASRLAGRVMGTLLAIVVPITVVGMAASHWLAAWLVSEISNDVVRARVTTVAQIFLLIFLPQVVFYVANLVSTASLNSERRFLVPAAAPLLNNLVVIATVAVLAVRLDGRVPTLGLDTGDLVILAVGTTFGVVCFCLAPVVAARRRGWRLRPRFVRHDAEVMTLVRDSGWAAGFVISTQVLMLALAWMANAVPGAVVVLQLCMMVVLVPYALFAVPAATTAFPDLADAHLDDDHPRLGLVCGRAVRSATYLALPAVALTVGLADPIARLVTWGRASGRVDDVAATLRATAPVIVGLGVTLVLSKVCFASGRNRDPFVVHGTIVVLSLVAVGTVWAESGGRSAWWLGATIATAHLVTALVLGGRIATGVLAGVRVGLVRPLLRRSALAVAVGVGCAALSAVLAPSGRLAAMVVVLVASLLALAFYVTGDVVGGGPSPRTALSTFGGAPDRGWVQ